MREGNFVLITAASSSTGLAAVQVAKAQGAVSIMTTRDRGKRSELLALEKLAERASAGAIISEYGWLSLAQTPFPLVSALQKGLTVRGYWLAEITTHAERLARAKSYVYDRVKSGQLKPKIAKPFPFEK